MNTTRHYLLFFVLFWGHLILAQQARQQYLNEWLFNKKEEIRHEEKEQLKAKIKKTNDALLEQHISQIQADSLKMLYAKETLGKIEKKIQELETHYYLTASSKDDQQLPEKQPTSYIKQKTKLKHHISDDLVFVAGLNNLLDDTSTLENSPYELLKSYFVELGWSWKTNLLPRYNLINLRYGFSFQFHSISPKDKRIFTNNAGDIQRIPYDKPLKRNQLRYTHLVLPIHLQIGSNRKKYTTYSSEGRTITRSGYLDSFIIGIGGYGGLNIFNAQRIKGNGFKEKLKYDLNVTKIVYGVSGYLYFPRMFSIYVKKDLSPLFKGQTKTLNSIALGIRFDID